MTLMESAPLTEPEMQWPMPPVDGYVAEDLDTIPDLPPHTELIDGSLVIVSAQVSFHRRMLRALESALTEQAPKEYEAVREMTVTLGPKQRPEPDIMITWAAAETSSDQSDYKPEDVLLVAEVVSAESRVRDRERKPQLYAEAGFQRYWRIEKDRADGRPVVYTYELDPATKIYVPTGIHRGRLIASWPFPIDIDLDAIELPGN
jgi:Uma2 family endonuclease